MYEELLISGDQLPTANPKIFKSIEQFPQPEALELLIEQIRLAIMQNDHKTILEIFSKNVEGYFHNA
jgi:hypothetical protein